MAGAGAAGLTLLGERAAHADTVLVQAGWAHGHSVQPQSPEAIQRLLRTGSGTHVEQVTGGGWFHFAIPTPVVVNGVRVRIDRVLVAFRTSGPETFVSSIDVFDGEGALIKHGFEFGLFGDHSQPDSLGVVSVPGQPAVGRAIGITVRVEFRGTPAAPGWIDFISAGADFISPGLAGRRRHPHPGGAGARPLS
jgi:hypothetical protein